MRLPAALHVLRGSSFHMNALYLMLSTFVLAGAGFIFWIIVTRSYTASSVGLATTLLSVSGLISLFGLAGFDTTFVRFLPKATQKNTYINSGLIIVASITGVLAIAAALLLPSVSPSLHILREGWFFAAFVFFTVVSSLMVLVNSIFLAHKRARYTFLVNVLFSTVKIILPLLVIRGNEATIFIIAGVSQCIGLFIGLGWIRRTLHWRFRPRIDTQAIRLVRKFSSVVYTSSILNLIPPTLLPLIATHFLGPESAAYYYMAFTIATVLYTIAYASMQSVFAEGSHDETALHDHIKKALKLICLLLIPASLLILFLSNFLLSFFGREYQENAASLLQILALSSLPVAIYSAMGAIFKVTKNLTGIVVMNSVYAISILGCSYMLLSVHGITAIGWGWLLGNVAACLVGALFLFIKQRGVRGGIAN